MGPITPHPWSRSWFSCLEWGFPLKYTSLQIVALSVALYVSLSFSLDCKQCMLSFDVNHMGDYHKVIRGLLWKHMTLSFPQPLRGAEHLFELINIGSALLLMLCLIYRSSGQWFANWTLPRIYQEVRPSTDRITEKFYYCFYYYR